MPQQTVYWLILEIVVLVVFAAGLIGNVSFWLRGSTGPGQTVTTGEKIRAILRGVGAVLRPHVLGRALLDSLLQPRLLSLSPLRWLMHFGMFWGIIVLFFVGSVGLMLAERGLVPVAKDTPWFALLNEFAGLMVIFGAAAAMYRRVVLKEKQLRTATDDVALMVLLGFIVLSGYALEVVRLAAQQVSPAAGWYSFAGYALAKVMPSSLSSDNAYQVAWWCHAGAGMAFVAYIPYSKLFHMFASPLAIAVNAAIADERLRQRGKQTKASQSRRRAPGGGRSPLSPT